MSESKLEPFNPVNQSGHWRQVMARCTRNGHLMLIIGVRPQGLEPQQLEDLKDSIKNFFETGKGKEANVTSLYFQATDKRFPSSLNFLIYYFLLNINLKNKLL